MFTPPTTTVDDLKYWIIGVVCGVVLLMFLIMFCICWRWKSGGPAPKEKVVPIDGDGGDAVDAGVEEGEEVCIIIIRFLVEVDGMCCALILLKSTTK